MRRTTRRIELTEAGRVLHEDAVRVLADLEGADRARADEASRPALRIAYTLSAGYEPLLTELEVGGIAAMVRASGEITAHILREARPGSIILLHALPQSPAALPAIVRELRARALEPVGVGDLLASGAADAGLVTLGAGSPP